MTRVQRVLRDLRAAGDRGYCAFGWYAEARPNDRNAPSEINDMDGYEVVSVPCHESDHPKRGSYARHYLVKDPEAKPRQLALIA